MSDRSVTLPVIVRFLDGLVHPSAAADRVHAARHRSFIAVHFGAALIALAVLPLSLALRGPVSLAEAALFGWLVLPMAIAVYLSRSGRLEIAHLLSATVLTCLIVWLAGVTGGLTSLALVWLAVVPFEASLSGSRRVTAASGFIAFAGFLGLALAGWAGGYNGAGTGWVGALTIPAAIIYAGGLAVRLEGIARESARSARREEERYRLLADHATDMITRHARNGDVEFASPAVRRLTGFDPSVMLGTGLLDHVHIADRPIVLKALSDAFTTGAPVAAEFRLSRRDGDGLHEAFIDVEMCCRPAMDEHGQHAVVAVTRDITRRKASEDEMRHMRETAERANLAKSHFLAHMSHELRTPLNAIIGFSDILGQVSFGPGEADRIRDYARLIHQSGEHLLDVVNGILDMSKIESGMFDLSVEPIAVAPLIEGCCQMMTHQALQQGVILANAGSAGLPELVADRRSLRQMVINLVANAIKFSNRNGCVTVGARLDRDMVAIYVRDQGIGISETDLQRVGTPFVQVESPYHRRFAGTGLGLSTVKGLAALHGGRLEIESRLGAGTTATILLPLRGPATGQRQQQKPEAATEALEERKSA